MPRFFVPQDQIPIITGSDAHQIRNVLRMKPGDKLELFDGYGKAYQAEIQTINKDKVTCKILATQTSNSSSNIKVTLAQALPKGQKMDLIIQKCTELGIEQVIPMVSERSLPTSNKSARWQRIAKDAAEQSGRINVPEITKIKTFAEAIKTKDKYDLAIIPWELEQNNQLKPFLKQLNNDGNLTILIIIGPEGGFSQTEVQQAQTAGLIPITLGQRILRTETAGLAILSMINYEFEQ